MNCSQASGAVRFFHSKHECYIIGEGSFVGRYGKLPDLSEDDDSGHEISVVALDLKRRVSPTPRSPIQFEVKADVEPICETGESSSVLPSIFKFESQEQEEKIVDEEPLLTSRRTSLMLPGWQSRSRQSLHQDDTIQQSQTKSMYLSLPGDDVISEDGKGSHKECLIQWVWRAGSATKSVLALIVLIVIII